LAKDPARRPQSFAQIAQRLEIDSPKTVRAKRAEVEKAKQAGFPGSSPDSKPGPALYGGAAGRFSRAAAGDLVFRFSQSLRECDQVIHV
jgi:hypothetical protein